MATTRRSKYLEKDNSDIIDDLKADIMDLEDQLIAERMKNERLRLKRESRRDIPVVESVKKYYDEDEDLPPPPTPIKTVEQPAGQVGDITKKFAAREVYIRLKNLKTALLIGVVAPWVVVLGSMFHAYAGLGFAVFASGFLTYFLFNVQKEMKKLEQQYNVQ